MVIFIVFLLQNSHYFLVHSKELVSALAFFTTTRNGYQVARMYDTFYAIGLRYVSIVSPLFTSIGINININININIIKYLKTKPMILSLYFLSKLVTMTISQ